MDVLCHLRRDTNGFELSGSGDHAGGISEAKVVRARLHGLGASTGDGAHQGLDVDGLSLSDSLQCGDLVRGQTESHEVRSGKLLETLGIKVGFEMLEGQGTIG